MQIKKDVFKHLPYEKGASLYVAKYLFDRLLNTFYEKTQKMKIVSNAI